MRDWLAFAPAALLSCHGCFGGCGALYQDPVSLPTEGTVNPVAVPIDIAWETPLIIYSGGSPAPMGVPNAAATCIPAAQCVARVFLPYVTNDDPKLGVVGHAPGPAAVELRYDHPARHETMTARLHFAFLPAESMPEVDIGDELHATPFVWKHAPVVLEHHTPSGAPGDGGAPETSARCEGSTFVDPVNRYDCFPQEDVGGGERRFTSCRYSRRCSSLPGGVLVDGFSLCIERSGGQVVGAIAVASLHDGAPLRALGTWGQPTKEGCLPGE
jgi:hypothetical protein